MVYLASFFLANGYRDNHRDQPRDHSERFHTLLHIHDVNRNNRAKRFRLAASARSFEPTTTSTPSMTVMPMMTHAEVATGSSLRQKTVT
jgi:hypothetical protein